MTRVAEIDVPDEAFQAARKVFEEKELVDLRIAINLMNVYNLMAISFRNTPRAGARAVGAWAACGTVTLPSGANRGFAALCGRRSFISVVEIGDFLPSESKPRRFCNDERRRGSEAQCHGSCRVGERRWVSDREVAKKIVVDLINSTGLVAIDLGSLAPGGPLYQVGAPLSGLEFHFIRRLH